MTIFTFSNNVYTMLAGAFSSSATSFTLASSAHLPASIPSGEYLVITLNDAATRGNYEVIYVGTVSGATCSNLLRAQEGTAALSWLTGDYAYCGPTDGQMNQFTQIGQFPSSLATNGYKKYPDPNSPTGYFIDQWGTEAIPTNTTTTVTLPIAFPNSAFPPVVSLGSAITPGVTYTVGGDVSGLSQINLSLVSSGTGTLGVHWRISGY